MKHSFDDSYLKQHRVAFASDGASAVLGNRSGVAHKVLEHDPDIIILHYQSHRLELTVDDSMSEVSSKCSFYTFMDKLYSVYNRSPLNQRQLVECAAELEQGISKLGHSLSTIWVASSF